MVPCRSAGLTLCCPVIIEYQVTFADAETLGLFGEGSPPEFNCMNEYYGLSLERGEAVASPVYGTLEADKVTNRIEEVVRHASSCRGVAHVELFFVFLLCFPFGCCVVSCPVMNRRPPSACVVCCVCLSERCAVAIVGMHACYMYRTNSPPYIIHCVLCSLLS